MDPLQSSDVHIAETVWDHVDAEQKKGRGSFEMSFMKPEELSLKVT